MLGDLYLLHRYFETPDDSLPAEALIARYGAGAVGEALAGGLIELRAPVCMSGPSGTGARPVCRLSEKGVALARLAHGAG